jgi:hypothetical protein
MELNVTSAKCFNISLKQAIKELTGLNVKVSIINSYNFPKCWVQVINKHGFNFDNNFRLKVFDFCGFKREHLCNINDVYYGNIRSNMISAHVHEWIKLFKDEK